ncbi:hypothetical protein BU26DRAFT_596083 [Trematosphaeria pertusa]|uniref:Uncharacterized protein n=1 Tax=Trematosphaeria pertusa TaxID=390896 RepID=A0A6A6ICP0_9PLEO|nr:uncharacterized protein BU26DRAFT_596083 [Trematosphaeria pertusa]KAF2248186.1 hypothetical protein BU26DRAFT_596083 [Trematosphaeria pertusa]
MQACGFLASPNVTFRINKSCLGTAASIRLPFAPPTAHPLLLRSVSSSLNPAPLRSPSATAPCLGNTCFNAMDCSPADKDRSGGQGNPFLGGHERPRVPSCNWPGTAASHGGLRGSSITSHGAIPHVRPGSGRAYRANPASVVGRAPANSLPSRGGFYRDVGADPMSLYGESATARNPGPPPDRRQQASPAITGMAAGNSTYFGAHIRRPAAAASAQGFPALALSIGEAYRPSNHTLGRQRFYDDGLDRDDHYGATSYLNHEEFYEPYEDELHTEPYQGELHTEPHVLFNEQGTTERFHASLDRRRVASPDFFNDHNRPTHSLSLMHQPHEASFPAGPRRALNVSASFTSAARPSSLRSRSRLRLLEECPTELNSESFFHSK